MAFLPASIVARPYCKSGRRWLPHGRYAEFDSQAVGLHRPSAPVRSSSRKKNAASQLTPRERAAARRIARGLTNKQIAANLVIGEGTADRHVANILGKLGFGSRAQVAAWVVEHTTEMDAHPR